MQQSFDSRASCDSPVYFRGAVREELVYVVPVLLLVVVFVTGEGVHGESSILIV